VAALFDAEPGTYVLTDFLVHGFRRSVLTELGLDAHPELWPDYFGHYRRVVWLAQCREPVLEAEAQAVADMFRLPLTVVETGTARLERELEHLLADAGPRAPDSCPQTAAAPAPRPAFPSSRAQTAALTAEADHQPGRAGPGPEESAPVAGGSRRDGERAHGCAADW
jgi:hypothetical protein